MAKNAICTWDFTISKEKVDSIDNLKLKLTNYCKKWIFQLEEGSESKYQHYQGRVSLKTKARLAPKLDYGEHWSVTSVENSNNEFYCIKENSRINGPWSDRDKYIPRQVRNITLRPWQQSILDDRLVWNTRTINCIICKEGNIGKSTLVTYAGANGYARRIPMMESYKDFMRMVMDCPKSSLYLVDFPRSLNKQNCLGFWSALETVKDGYAYDDRYGFREEYFDSPNIWVFMNTYPDFKFLSKDRWKLWCVTNGELSFCNTKFVTTGTTGTDSESEEVG